MRYGVLILSFFFVIPFLIVKNYGTWTRPIEFVPEKGSPERPWAKTDSTPATLIQKEPLTNDSHIFISQKNIFTPDRREFPAPEGKKPVVRPQVILYGVTMADDYQSACIGNPGSPVKKGEREAMTLKIGDKIGEYKLAKILPDRIALEAMEDTFEVLLYDPAKPKQRLYAKTETKPATITTVLSASPASSTTSSGSSQIIPSQEASRASESVRDKTAKPQVPKPAPPTPSPSPRSGRTPVGPAYAASPSTPMGPPGEPTQPKNL
jgi:hypothetical protein